MQKIGLGWLGGLGFAVAACVGDSQSLGGTTAADTGATTTMDATGPGATTATAAPTTSSGADTSDPSSTTTGDVSTGSSETGDGGTTGDVVPPLNPFDCDNVDRFVCSMERMVCQFAEGSVEPVRDCGIAFFDDSEDTWLAAHECARAALDDAAPLMVGFQLDDLAPITTAFLVLHEGPVPGFVVRFDGSAQPTVTARECIDAGVTCAPALFQGCIGCTGGFGDSQAECI